MSERLIKVARIQRFSTKDGPGVRTTVFLKGCPLKCKWCHNPETQLFKNELLYAESVCAGCGRCVGACARGAHIIESGRHIYNRKLCAGCGECAKACPTGACEMASEELTLREIISEAERDRAFYTGGGGLTLSGGEPMASPENCLAIIEAAREAGINTTIETCGYFDEKWIPPLASLADTILYDIKDSDPERHIEYTGVSNAVILRNLRALDRYPIALRIRCIMAAGVNLNEAHLRAITDIYKTLKRATGVDLMPLHAYGASKAAQLGRAREAYDKWIPSEAQIRYAEAYLKSAGVPVTILA